MAQVVFSGNVTSDEGETVTITVTKPDTTQEVLTATTQADQTYSVQKEYTTAGAYTSQAHVDPSARYKAWDSAVEPFTIELEDRTGTLNVTIT